MKRYFKEDFAPVTLLAIGLMKIAFYVHCIEDLIMGVAIVILSLVVLFSEC